MISTPHSLIKGRNIRYDVQYICSICVSLCVWCCLANAVHRLCWQIFTAATHTHTPKHRSGHTHKICYYLYYVIILCHVFVVVPCLFTQCYVRLVIFIPTSSASFSFFASHIHWVGAATAFRKTLSIYSIVYFGCTERKLFIIMWNREESHT